MQKITFSVSKEQGQYRLIGVVPIELFNKGKECFKRLLQAGVLLFLALAPELQSISDLIL